MGERSGFDRLVVACAAVRVRALLTTVVLVFSIAGFMTLVLSVLPIPVREGRGSTLPLMLATLIWVGFAVGAWVVRKIWRTIQPRLLAEEIDEGVGLGAGDVRAALELGTSPGTPGASLIELHRTRISTEILRLGPDKLLPRTGPQWARWSHRSILLGVAIFGILTAMAWIRPEPTISAALALGSPWRTAFPPPLSTLRLSGSTGVPRGDRGLVEISAVGREAVLLASRETTGRVVRRTVAIGVEGSAKEYTNPIHTVTLVWVEDDDGSTSDTLRVRPLEPLLVQDLQVLVQYPRYLGRESESYRAQIPPLVLPEGTRLTISGETNLGLDTGFFSWAPELVNPVVTRVREIPLEVSGTRFSATWIPRVTGVWRWNLEASESMGSPVTPDPIRVLIVPDQLPRIELLYPSRDTTLGFEKVMPIVVDVEDDIELLRVAIRTWRSGLGEEQGEHTEDLMPAPAGAQRSVFRHLIDRSSENLLPGDTVFYVFEAFDRHPSRGPAISDVFILRVPTFTEIRDQRAEGQEALADAARELEERMEALAEAAADAARQADTEEGESEEAQFAATEEARSVLEEAERADEDLAGLDEELQRLRDELIQSPISDPALKEQLEKLGERYEELVAEGLAGRIEELSAALRDLDSKAMQTALEAMGDDSERLREQLEQTLGLLEQAAFEQAMKATQASADDLAEAQRNLADETDAELFQTEQEELLGRAENLIDRLETLQEELAESGREMAADSAAVAEQRTQEAVEKMDQAQGEFSEMASGDTGEVSQDQQSAAEQAAEALERASSALSSAQQGLSGETSESAVQSLAHARTEALSLAREEGRLADVTRGEETADPMVWRAEQGAVRQGLENLLRRLSDSGNQAAMLDQETGAAAGSAVKQMDQLLDLLSEDGGRRLPSRAEAEDIQHSLNELAQRLLTSEQAAEASREESAGQETAEQMAQLAQQQQMVTQQTSSMLVPGPKPAGQEQIQEQLVRRQEEIASDLGELEDPESDLLGRPEELAREAAELARQLELQGPTQETLERQRQLFRRMLDAGRSLEDENLDPNRRESEAATAASREPPSIDPTLIRERQFPLPLEAFLHDLPAFYRPLIFNYFDRLNRSSLGSKKTSRRDP
jgi:hypothetical protein